MSKVLDVNELIVRRLDESYLISCAQNHKFSYGLIIGHTVEANKIVVVHFAKNNEDADVLEDAENQTVNDINTHALANQWVNAYKMCPGSFTVIGIFVAANRENILDENSSEFKLLKTKMNEIYNILISSHSEVMDYMYNTDLFVVAYATPSYNSICRQYKHSNNGGQLVKASLTFVAKRLKWQLIECTYQLDDVFPLLNVTSDIHVENEYRKANNKLKNILDNSEIFIENEFVDDNLLLCDYTKEMENNSKQTDSSLKKSIIATVLTPLKLNKMAVEEAERRVESCKSAICFKGGIYSRIWCNKQCTIGEVKNYVRTDILRSLMTRVQMYCDGLTDSTIKDTKLFVSELPRRVYFHLEPHQNPYENFQLYDYIFHGESPTVAVAQAKQILDVDIPPDSITVHLENTVDEAMFVEHDLVDEKTDKQREQPVNTMLSLLKSKLHFLSFFGVFAAVFLLISLWLPSSK